MMGPLYIYISSLLMPIIISQSCEVQIRQDPHSIESWILESAKIHCIILADDISEISLYKGNDRLMFLQHGRTLNVTKKYKHRIHVLSPLSKSLRNISVTLQDLHVIDSGSYMCKAKVRNMFNEKEICGTGTKIKVSVKPWCSSASMNQVPFTLRGLTIYLLVSGFILL